MNSGRYQKDTWKIIEAGFDPEFQRASESIFSLGNGKMGQRANFEEDYSGDSLQGSYIAGIYYPDKTRVGWWKNGYPEYFAKVLNAPNWIGFHLFIDEQPLDLARMPVSDFRRILDIKRGILERSFTVEPEPGKKVHITAIRFLSMKRDETGCIRYTIRPDFSSRIRIVSYIDADVRNEDANYNEKFWETRASEIHDGMGCILVKTKKLDFYVATGISTGVTVDGYPVSTDISGENAGDKISFLYNVEMENGSNLAITKYGAVLSSLYHPVDEMVQNTWATLQDAKKAGFDVLLAEHVETWAKIWEEKDFVIEGDVAAQQGIRFNIFQLQQTYTGKDERLNIGPKGFTGEKYGGSTYWDTEAFAFPFYLYSGNQSIARNLLLYRYKHLQKAIENAEKLGFSGGAALYPMVTMNGEECHNEWEITFEEIHRNGAIAYAIYKYLTYTGDEEYLAEFGLEVLIALSRFWTQRAHFSKPKNKYVIHGVTGPNEYENNVNNNWYTNYIATWTLRFTIESVDSVRKGYHEKWEKIKEKTGFSESEEQVWEEVAGNMFFPEDPGQGIFLQQEGYLDKEQRMAAELDPAELPLNQHWSWDRILRSCFIKQADVLQGLYFFEDHFDRNVIARNFNFYEPRTVHESSLSPCVHSIIASRIGDPERAYKLYLRTSRLDLDDYNHEVGDGLHITSMAGTWLALVEGFAGLKIRDRQLFLAPQIPDEWKRYRFGIMFHGSRLLFDITQDDVSVTNQSGIPAEIYLYQKPHSCPPGNEIRIPLKKTEFIRKMR